MKTKIQHARQHFSALTLNREENDLAVTGRRLQTVLEETDAVLQECERHLDGGAFPHEEIALLEGQREQLELLDREFEAIFQTIESKLNEAGLTEKVSRLREFVQYDRTQMSNVQRQLEIVNHSGKTGSREILLSTNCGGSQQTDRLPYIDLKMAPKDQRRWAGDPGWR